MNLGIERSTMDDISVGEKEAYLFCLESIADFICDQLHQVRHTSVTCEIVTEMKELAMEEPKKEIIQVVSPRADAVIAKVYNLSRDESLNLFRAQKVYVTGRLCENNSKLLKAGDVVNARGFGKFVFVAEKGETKKGKINVEVAVYR
jgi:RNA-binding protein YlmH